MKALFFHVAHTNLLPTYWLSFTRNLYSKVSVASNLAVVPLSITTVDTSFPSRAILGAGVGAFTSDDSPVDVIVVASLIDLSIGLRMHMICFMKSNVSIRI